MFNCPNERKADVDRVERRPRNVPLVPGGQGGVWRGEGVGGSGGKPSLHGVSDAVQGEALRGSVGAPEGRARRPKVSWRLCRVRCSNEDGPYGGGVRADGCSLGSRQASEGRRRCFPVGLKGLLLFSAQLFAWSEGGEVNTRFHELGGGRSALIISCLHAQTPTSPLFPPPRVAIERIKFPEYHPHQHEHQLSREAKAVGGGGHGVREHVDGAWPRAGFDDSQSGDQLPGAGALLFLAILLFVVDMRVNANGCVGFGRLPIAALAAPRVLVSTFFSGMSRPGATNDRAFSSKLSTRFRSPLLTARALRYPFASIFCWCVPLLLLLFSPAVPPPSKFFFVLIVLLFSVLPLFGSWLFLVVSPAAVPVAVARFCRPPRPRGHRADGGKKQSRSSTACACPPIPTSDPTLRP